ncbi:hypothetical protein BBI09_16665 [Stutzerimonas xanthomarina]|nr:hypothetical protein BBI09_16665 [Stutzerimonas xanthomarina]
MGTLLDLIASIGQAQADMATATPLNAARFEPAANEHQQQAGEPSQTSAMAPTSPGEPKRTAWRITRAGQPIGYMVGQPMTYSEALACVLIRWPDVERLDIQ